mmetsp:Transcript_13387/g.22794  ORF Transcript_13387/g.22794 Transcript_13387/m.22794 type:complete len:147 (-) Transcript_13387:122-562(-)
MFFWGIEDFFVNTTRSIINTINLIMYYYLSLPDDYKIIPLLLIIIALMLFFLFSFSVGQFLVMLIILWGSGGKVDFEDWYSNEFPDWYNEVISWSNYIWDWILWAYNYTWGDDPNLADQKDQVSDFSNLKSSYHDWPFLEILDTSK